MGIEVMGTVGVRNENVDRIDRIYSATPIKSVNIMLWFFAAKPAGTGGAQGSRG